MHIISPFRMAGSHLSFLATIEIRVNPIIGHQKIFVFVLGFAMRVGIYVGAVLQTII